LKLEKVANIAIVIACVAVVGQVGLGMLKTKTAHTAAPYLPGSLIRDTAELGLKTAHRNVILVTRSTCHFCTESMPFYETLISEARASGVRVVAATAEDLNTNRAYLASHGVMVDAVISDYGNKISASSTPTVILVGNDSKVVGAWKGKLQPGKEKELLDAVRRNNS